MGFQYTPYIPPLLLAATLSAVIAFGAWRRRGRVPGAISAAVLMLGVAWWSLAYAFQLSSTTLAAKLAWSRAVYLGMVVIPSAWLAFALAYTGRGQLLTRGNVAILAVEPLVTVVLAWTNGSHGLIHSSARLSTGFPAVMLDLTNGPWLWIDVVYSYALNLLGCLLLLQAYFGAPSYYRGQVGVLLLGAGVPWVAEIVSFSGLTPFPHVDLTPIAFVFSGLAVLWGVYRYGLMDIVPVALETVFRKLSDGIIVLDPQDRVVDLNPSAEAILGGSASSVVGQLAADILPGCPHQAVDHMDSTETHEEISLGLNGGLRHYDLRITPLHDLSGRRTGRVVAFRDISERKRAEEIIKQMAYYDELTGLPNRRLFKDRLDLEMAHAVRNGQQLALLMLDLDGFKEVNDALGHRAGDQMLKIVAARLKELLRKSDTAARLGGDEFLLLLPEMLRGEHAGVVAQRVLEAVREPIRLDGHELRPSASIGISVYPRDGEDAEALIKKADLAMYHAKREGRNNYFWYTPDTMAGGFERGMARSGAGRPPNGDGPTSEDAEGDGQRAQPRSRVAEIWERWG